MTTTMDSPDRNPIVPSTDCQGSPLFHFLCSLSPIKGVTSSGCGARTFSELSFPPPPPVFVSPKVESRKDGAPKRKILAGSAQDKQEECNVSIKSSLQVLSGSNKETLSSTSAANSSPTSTSMPDLKFPITHTSSVEQELRLHMQDSKGLCMVSSENEDVKEPFDKPPTVHLSSQSNPEKKLDQPTQHLSCQTTTENNHKAPELSRHNLEKLHAVWSVPMDYLSRILTSIRGTPAVEDDDPPGSSESDLLPQAITETSSLHENEELEAEGEQHFCRANPSGFRRRCLDFQTSDIHQKALHNLPMLRMIGLSSDNPSRTGFPTTLDNNTVTPFSEYHAMKYPSMEHQRSTSNVWDNSMPTDFDLSEMPPCPSIPNPAQHPHYNASYLANQCENSQVINNKRFTFGLEAAQTALQVSRLGYSFSSISQSRVDGADNLPLSMQSKGSLSKSFLKGKTDIQQNLSSNLVDQELLLSLAERTIINQHHYQGENNAAHVALQTPTAFHQPIAVEFDTIHRNPGELGSRSTAVLENTAIAQESSHQSESDHLEEFTCSPRSPRKKRKLSIQTGDNGGESCKNCKCKKSKCLKLYCECFAAGVYCIDICNCHDCYNKPEFEETVLGTRQQIESRNPLAFVPKIIRAPDSSPSVGEECKETPASARHKRGCNCKKSQCLKKYCECYQAGVGCADGCRCEGCKNVFGRNEGSEDLEEKVQQTDALDLKNATTSALNDMEQKLTPEHLNVQKGTDFSPITPYLENPGPCRSDVEMGPVQRFTSPFAHPISSLTFQSPSTFLELLEEARNLGQANLQTHPTRCPGLISDSSELSPGWTRQDAMYKSTPLSQPLQQLTTVVADAVLNTSNAYQPLWQNYDASLSHIKRYMPALKMDIPANPSQLQATENAITIPVTPLLSNTTHTTRTTFGDLSESRYQQSAWLTDEDDSPSVLRELNSFCAPEVVTKTRSPQQKRIFSYQRNPKAVNLKSTASGLASCSGGKFIFQSLPNTGYPDKPR